MNKYMLALLASTLAACGGKAPAHHPFKFATKQSIDPGGVVSLTLNNVGGTACGSNSLGGGSFFSSCTGNNGLPEYWCADFAKWVWANNGVDVTGLNAAAGSFYTYGEQHGTLSNIASPGAVAIFNYQGGGVADHVAVVTKVNPDGSIETASGDWNGQPGDEATFSSTSTVVVNTPAFSPAPGTTPAAIGVPISAYVVPAEGLDCSVHADGKLYCGNIQNSAIYADTSRSSAVVDYLRSSYSYFDCWTTGEADADGNNTWYHSNGDDTGAWGYLPAASIYTTPDFDSDPSAHGLQRCN